MAKAKAAAFSEANARKVLAAANRIGMTSLSRAPLPVTSHTSHTSVKARNDTGANLPRGAVIDLGDYLLSASDPLDAQHLWFEGIAQEGTARRYAVAREPIPTNEIGECQVSGVCIARVNVTDLAHNYAVPTASQNYFTSSPIGPVEIQRLSTPESTGTQECVVLLRVPGPTAYVAKTGGSPIAALTSTTPGSGTVTLYAINDSGVLESLSETVTAYNIASGEVAADTWIQIKLCAGKWVIDFESCPA